MKNPKLTLIVLAPFLLAACARSVGRDFKLETLTTFQAGKTQKADVQAVMGQPVSRDHVQDGREKWYYYSAQGESVNFLILGTHSTNHWKRANFYFKGETLDDLKWEETYSITDSVGPYAAIGKKFTDADLQTLHKGTTTTQDVLTKFGLPFERHCQLNGTENWLYAYGTTQEGGHRLRLRFEHGLLAESATETIAPASK